MGHGYAGIDNELYVNPKTGMYFADAKQGLADLVERHRFVALTVEPVHLAVKDRPLRVQVGVGGVGRSGAEHVVLEDRHRPGVGFPVRLR